MAILVTGGAGFIGSHTVVELQNAGYDVVVLDNLSNASEKSLQRVEKITGKPVTFYKADILARERQIIMLRYGLINGHEKTQREIGAMLGISRSYVSRIEKRALEKLREGLEEKGVR